MKFLYHRALGDETEDRPPQFTMRIRDRRVQMSYPVRLTCQVAGHPAPEVTWYKDSAEIRQDGKYTLNQPFLHTKLNFSWSWRAPRILEQRLEFPHVGNYSLDAWGLWLLHRDGEERERLGVLPMHPGRGQRNSRLHSPGFPVRLGSALYCEIRGRSADDCSSWGVSQCRYRMVNIYTWKRGINDNNFSQFYETIFIITFFVTIFSINRILMFFARMKF